MGAEESELLTERMYSTSCGIQSSTDQNTVTSYTDLLIMLKSEVLENFGVFRSAINNHCQSKMSDFRLSGEGI